jgi:hypothetical protein
MFKKPSLLTLQMPASITIIRLFVKQRQANKLQPTRAVEHEDFTVYGAVAIKTALSGAG